MKKFREIRERAEARKGGKQALEALLPKPLLPAALAALPDDRCLSMMSKCVFRAGFNWSVIDKKWPGIEQAFHGFSPVKLVYLSPDTWDNYLTDTRIVRNWQKIKTVYENARFVMEISEQHGSFGKFLASWPASDQIGLMQVLKKQGSRLGGKTVQYFLRYIGKDGFILSPDVVLALQDAGVDINDNPASQRDQGKIQRAFNEWHGESGLPYSHISKIAAYSCGRDYDSEFIRREMQKVGELPG